MHSSIHFLEVALDGKLKRRLLNVGIRKTDNVNADVAQSAAWLLSILVNEV